jgi:hypothetical protein
MVTASTAEWRGIAMDCADKVLMVDKQKTGAKLVDGPKARARDVRAEKLADALRANLKRRKSAARQEPETSKLAENVGSKDGSAGCSGR